MTVFITRFIVHIIYFNPEDGNDTFLRKFDKYKTTGRHDQKVHNWHINCRETSVSYTPLVCETSCLYFSEKLHYRICFLSKFT